uniref:Uncharacterized protein n=1 Tax=Anguilla anguilla TaxID=7936 RepID=A0A0E9SNI8_ANGAN
MVLYISEITTINALFYRKLYTIKSPLSPKMTQFLKVKGPTPEIICLHH